jgi:RNA polymerase sigma-70 factor (ECF subfamily)
VEAHADAAGFPAILTMDPTPTRTAAHRSFAQYVEPELDVLLRVARSLTRDAHDAEDLVQDTLTRAFRAIERFDGRHPRAWLLTILRNTHKNRGRRRRPMLGRMPDTVAVAADRQRAAGDDEPEQHALRAEDAADIAGALARLARRHRTVVELVDLDGLSYAEAAVVLGVPEGTVTSRLHRARARLRAELGPQVHTPDDGEQR